MNETYIPVTGAWTYLYRALDPMGATIDFWLPATRDAAAARRFFQRALQIPARPRQRVINVDGSPSYPQVVAELKREGKLGRRCRCRTCPYLNNNLEQDHRAIKRRVQASQGFRSFDGAWRTIQGYEAAYDLDGAGAVVIEKGCGWPGAVRKRDSRLEGCLIIMGMRHV